MCSLFQTVVGPDGLLKIADGVGALPPGAILKGNGCYVTDQDLLIVDSTAPAKVTFNGGVGFTVTGRVAIVIDPAGGVDRFLPNAMPVDVNGDVVIVALATIDHYTAGVGVSLADGGAIAGLPPA